MGKIICALFLQIFLYLFLWFLLVLMIVFSYFDYNEIDWNNNGSVSLAEIFDALDVVKIKTKTSEDNCLDYLWAKDGSFIKTICGKANKGESK